MSQNGLLALLLLLAAIIIVLYFLRKKKASLVKENSANTTPPLYISYSEYLNDDDDPFTDKFGYMIKDYYHLTPSEAQQELNERKDFGEYIPREEYFGYIDVIASKNDDKYLDHLDTLSPEKARAWLNRKLENEQKLSIAVWKKLAEIISPADEEYLLEKLKSVKSNDVIPWINRMKKKGYFFSHNVYEACRERHELSNQ